jgi:serine/threonine-protein kinase ATR
MKRMLLAQPKPKEGDHDRMERYKNTVASYQENTRLAEDFLSKIPHTLIAEASYQSNSYARALLHYEKHVRIVRESDDKRELQSLYGKLQQVYSKLEDSDALDGIFTMFINPSLEEQIIHHEATGKWNLAQSCYEVFQQKGSNDIEHQIGMVKCLTNLGHNEAVITTASGMFSRQSSATRRILPYAITAASNLGDYKNLEIFLNRCTSNEHEVTLGKILLSIHKGNTEEFQSLIRQCRSVVTGQLAAASGESYQRAYDSSLRLSLLHDVESFYSALNKPANEMASLEGLFNLWDHRLPCMMSSLKVREPALRLHHALLRLIIAYQVCTRKRRQWISQFVRKLCQSKGRRC